MLVSRQHDRRESRSHEIGTARGRWGYTVRGRNQSIEDLRGEETKQEAGPLADGPSLRVFGVARSYSTFALLCVSLESQHAEEQQHGWHDVFDSDLFPANNFTFRTRHQHDP